MTTETRHSVAVRFELPATDFDRACAFWQAVMGTTLKGETMGPMRMAVFPHEKPNISGAVIAGPGYRPGAEGPVVHVIDSEGDRVGLHAA